MSPPSGTCKPYDKKKSSAAGAALFACRKGCRQTPVGRGDLTPPPGLPPHPLWFRRGRCPHRPAVTRPHPRCSSVGAGFYPARLRSPSFRASAHTGVGIRSPSPPSVREVSRPKAVTEGEICRGINLKGRSAPRRGVLLPPAAKVPKNAVQTCGLKIPYAPLPVAYLVYFSHANTVLCKFPLNVALSLLL